MTNTKKISVQIIEDYTLIRKSLRFLLEKDTEIEITGCFDKAEDFFANLKDKNIDILILDLKLSGLNGYELLKKIKSEKPDLKILVICAILPMEDIFSVFTFGANGFCPIELKFEKIIEIIKAIYKNDNSKLINKYCSPEMQQNAVGIDKTSL